MTDVVWPDSVALALPEEWDEVPLDATGYRDFVSSRLDLLKASGTLGRSDLRQFELLLSLVFQISQEHDVIIASNFLSVERTNRNDEDDVVLMAGLMVSTMRRADLGIDIPLSAELMVKTFSQGTPADDAAARFDEIEPPDVCEIGGHVATKLLRLMTVELSPGDEFKQFTQTFLVPVAEGDAMIVLQFSTINFDYAREFTQLFDNIAKTLRVLYPDDPTFLDEATAGRSEPLDEQVEIADGISS